MRGERVDLTGRTYNFIDVLSRAPRNPTSYDSRWNCRCRRCGKEFIAYGLAIKAGTQKTCGHCGYREEMSAVVNRTHGDTAKGRTRRYISWMSAKGRVFNPNDPKYPRYGARGITMCARWANDYSAFAADMGEMPRRKLIDRIDNDGHYSCGKCPQCIQNGWPFNCKWSTPKESANNRGPRRRKSLTSGLL